ncbi:MAG: 50S ribosomal protein L25 [Bacteroidota bacterium]
MKTITINALRRDTSGKKSAKKLRNQGFIPGVIYGSQEGKDFPIHFVVAIDEIHPLSYQTCFIDLKIGQKSYTCILQEKQIHPVSDSPLHIDLLAISSAKKVKMDIPVIFTGKSTGVLKGGLLVRKMRKVRVEADMQAIPETIEVDIAHLDLGQSVRVREIVAQDFTILSPLGSPIAIIEIPRSMRSSKNKDSASSD